MNSTRLVPVHVADGRSAGALGHSVERVMARGRALVMTALFALSLPLSAQSGSIVTHPLPAGATGVFDAAGNLYTFGTTGPVTDGAYQTAPGGGVCFFGQYSQCHDAYVAKTDAQGNLVFGTWIGGSSEDTATAVAVDAQGNIYVTGTAGVGFPVTAGAAGTYGSVFLSKLSPDGKQLLYSTYIQGLNQGLAVAVDAQGAAYVAGAGVFPAFHGGALPTLGLVKVSPDGSAFLYQGDAGLGQFTVTAMAADASGDLAIASTTRVQTQDPSVNAFQTSAYLVKVDSSGKRVFSTLLGAGGKEPLFDGDTRGHTSVNSITMDSAGNVYVAGTTASRTFPTTPDSFQPAPVVPAWSSGGSFGYAAKLTADSGAVVWATYVTGETARMAVTASGDVFVAGQAGSGVPVTASAPQFCDGGTGWAQTPFIEHLGQHGELLDATYAGGDQDQLRAIGMGADGAVLLAWSRGQANGAATIQFGGAGSVAQNCVSQNVVNSATILGGGVAPGELVTLTGLGMGPEQGVAYTAGPHGEIPNVLGSVQVLFDGVPAPVLYAQSRQVNTQVPFEVLKQPLTRVSVLKNGVSVAEIDVFWYGAAPGLFRMQPGVSAQAVAINPDGTFNSETNPVARGEFVSLWGTGFGPTSPACQTGGLNLPYAANLDANYVAQSFSVGTAFYLGSSPTLPCGVQQVNLRVRTDLPLGEVEVVPRMLVQRPDGSSVVRTGGSATIWVK